MKNYLVALVSVLLCGTAYAEPVGKLVGWGYSNPNNVITFDSGDYSKVAVGGFSDYNVYYHHVVAVNDERKAIGWGWNEAEYGFEGGQLDFTFNNDDVTEIAFTEHNIALVKNDKVKVWGGNNFSVFDANTYSGTPQKLFGGPQQLFVVASSSSIACYGDDYNSLFPTHTKKDCQEGTTCDNDYSALDIRFDGTVCKTVNSCGNKWYLWSGIPCTLASPQLTVDVVKLALVGKSEYLYSYNLVTLWSDGTVTVKSDDDGLNEPYANSDIVDIVSGNCFYAVLYSGGAIDVECSTGSPCDTSDCNSISDWPSSGDIVQIAAGNAHMLALSEDDEVYAWGDNSYGQCDVPVSEKIPASVWAGNEDSAIIYTDGSVATFGRTTSEFTPPAEPNDALFAFRDYGDVVSVAVGYDNTYVQLDNNLSAACGNPTWLGNPPSNSYGKSYGITAVSASGRCSGYLLMDGSIMLRGSGGNIAEPEDAGYDEIAVGYRGSNGDVAGLVIRAGEITRWLNNTNPTPPSPNSNWHSPVYSSDGDTFGAIRDGGAYLFGDISPSEPSLNEYFVKLAIGSNFAVGLKANGTLVAWGDNSSGQCNIPGLNAGFIDVSASWKYAVGVRGECGDLSGDGDINQIDVAAFFDAITVNVTSLSQHMADLNNDDSVDKDDFYVFTDCFDYCDLDHDSGHDAHDVALMYDAMISYQEAADFDNDQDVDENDLFIFTQCYDYTDLDLDEEHTAVDIEEMYTAYTANPQDLSVDFNDDEVIDEDDFKVVNNVYQYADVDEDSDLDNYDVDILFDGFSTYNAVVDFNGDSTINSVDVAIFNQSFLFSDLDGDGDVDTADYNMFITSYNRSCGSQYYNPDCDYDNDCTVGYTDYGRWLSGYNYKFLP